MALLQLKDLNKGYGKGSKTVCVLNRFNLSINAGEMIAIMGKSGAGKTTLLNLIAGIDYPDDGEYIFNDRPVYLKRTADGVKFRRNQVGIIVQHFALINDFTVYENVEMGLWESKLSRKGRRERTLEVIHQLGIESLKGQYPPELSGGEKQRTAIGRAIVAKPQLLLADEPTGSLDAETEKEILRILKMLNDDGATIIIITHDTEVASQCSRVITLEKH